MRCSASPTTSIAAEASPDAARTAQSAVEALLFAQVLRPLAGALGPLGDVFASELAAKLAAPRDA